MKILYILFFALSIPAFINAQDKCTCSTDLDALYASVIKMPSYKNQFKGKHKADYQKMYDNLKRQSASAGDNFTCYKILVQLLYPLKDNHLGFWQQPTEKISGEMIVDTAFIKKYRASSAFKKFPTVKINYDSLNNNLLNKPLNDVEGIYHYNNYLMVGVYRTHKRDSLIGVVL